MSDTVSGAPRMAHALVAMAVLALVTAIASGAEVAYGEVRINVDEPATRVTSYSGYLAYPVEIENTSESDRDIELRVIGDAMQFESLVVRRLSLSVRVPARSTVRSAFYLPPATLAANRAEVFVDGAKQRETIGIGHASHTSLLSGRWYSGSSEPLVVLASRNVPPDVRVGLEDRASGDGRYEKLEIVRAERETGEWLTDWVAYSRYSSVIVAADEWLTTPASVRAALAAYARSGGLLTVVGRGVRPADVLGYDPEPSTASESGFYPSSFGGVRVGASLPEADYDRFLRSMLNMARERPTRFDASDAESVMRSAPDSSLPMTAILSLLVVMAVVIGPVNLIVLARMRRRAMLFFTTPIIGLTFAAATFAVGLLNDGLSARVVSRTVTVLDHRIDRATTLGQWACYTPLPPRDGVSAPLDAEVTPIGRDAYDGSAISITLDRGTEQVLGGSLIRSRIPGHMIVRRDAQRRERVEIEREGDAWVATNGLGVGIETFAFVSVDGDVWTAGAIEPGQRARLTRTKTIPTAVRGGLDIPRSPRELWRFFDRDDDQTFGRVPNTYTAVLTGEPFLGVSIAGDSEESREAVVVGILNGGGP